MDIRQFSPEQMNNLIKHATKRVRLNEMNYNTIFKSYLRKVITQQSGEITNHYNIVTKLRKYQMDDELREYLFTTNFSLRPERPYKLFNTDIKNPMLSWDDEDGQPAKFDNKNMLLGFPAHLHDPAMSGFQRLKIAFCPWIFNSMYNLNEANIYNFNWRFMMNCSFYCGMFGGCFQGITYGVQYLKTYDKTSKNRFVFESKSEAILSRHNSFIRGFARYSYRWGWRLGLFSLIGMTTHESLCVYSLQDKPSYYFTSAAVAGGLYKWTQGPYGIIRTGLMAAVTVGLLSSVLSQIRSLRGVSYFCYIDPKVTSPYYYANQTHEQKLSAEKTCMDILKLINIPEAEVTEKTIELCEVYVGPIKHSEDEFGEMKPKKANWIEDTYFK